MHKEPQPPADNKQMIVVITSVCTLLTTIIGLVTLGVKFNDRLYASRDAVARLETQVHGLVNQNQNMDAKLNYLIRSASVSVPGQAEDEYSGRRSATNRIRP